MFHPLTSPVDFVHKYNLPIMTFRFEGCFCICISKDTTDNKHKITVHFFRVAVNL